MLVYNNSGTGTVIIGCVFFLIKIILLCSVIQIKLLPRWYELSVSANNCDYLSSREYTFYYHSNNVSCPPILPLYVPNMVYFQPNTYHALLPTQLSSKKNIWSGSMYCWARCIPNDSILTHWRTSEGHVTNTMRFMQCILYLQLHLKWSCYPKHHNSFIIWCSDVQRSQIH